MRKAYVWIGFKQDPQILICAAQMPYYRVSLWGGNMVKSEGRDQCTVITFHLDDTIKKLKKTMAVDSLY